MAERLASKSTGLWVLLALLAASIEPIVVKLGYKTGVTPLQLLVVRNVFAAVTILLLTRSWKWPGWDGIRRIASVSLLLLATNGLMLYALRSLSAVTVITAVTTTPAFVAIVNQMRGRDVLGPKFWLGFSACFAGVLLTVDAFDAQRQAYDAFGVMALVLAVASSTTYRTRMENVTAVVPPRTVSTYIFLINALVVTVFVLPWVGLPPVEALPSSVWIGVAAALANLAFLSAIHLLGATRMSIFDMLQRPLVIVFAAVVLEEPFTLLQGVGVALVLAGVHFAKVKRRAAPTPPPQVIMVGGEKGASVAR